MAHPATLFQSNEEKNHAHGTACLKDNLTASTHMRRKDAGLVALLVGCLVCPLLQVSSDTVLSISAVEMLPEGDFGDASEWTIDGMHGFGGPLEYTSSEITNGNLMLSHQRPLNSVKKQIWASDNISAHPLSTGAPDGASSTSDGPVIEVGGFSESVVGTSPIISVTLLIAAEIPQQLNDDEVRLYTKWGNGSRDLIHTWFHSDTPLNAMLEPWWRINLTDQYGWSGTTIADLSIEVDYHATGGKDDSSIYLDAVGIEVDVQRLSNGFEIIQARHTLDLPMQPWFDIGLTSGTRQGLDMAPCGLSTTSPSNGTWTSETIEIPAQQRATHVSTPHSGNITAYWGIPTENGEVTQWQILPLDGRINETDDLKIRIEVENGCLEAVRIDINDTVLSAKGVITGELAGLDSNSSSIALKIDGEIIAQTALYSGNFELSGSTHEHLKQGANLEIRVRIQWADQGAEESFSLAVNSVELSEGYNVSIDLDPVCSRTSDITMDEDDPTYVVNIIAGCSDDRTDQEDLVVSASIENQNLASAIEKNGRIHLTPAHDRWGDTRINIGVTDDASNTIYWSFTLHIDPKDDRPSIDRTGLPNRIYIEADDVFTANISFTDPDTSSSTLVISSDTDWVSVSRVGLVTISPTAAGTYPITISVSDGTTSETITFIVECTIRPDLVVKEMTPTNGQVITYGEPVKISALIKNEGRAFATAFSVTLFIDGIDRESEPILGLEPGREEKIEWTWAPLSNSDAVEIKILIDETERIAETSEVNNEEKIVVKIDHGVSTGSASGERSVSALEEHSTTLLGSGAGIVILVAIGLILFGPGKIRKIR